MCGSIVAASAVSTTLFAGQDSSAAYPAFLAGVSKRTPRGGAAPKHGRMLMASRWMLSLLREEQVQLRIFAAYHRRPSMRTVHFCIADRQKLDHNLQRYR